MSSANKVGVIIPAHNEEVGIVNTLTALYKQTILPDVVIVSADNCTDATVKMAERFKGVLPLVVFETINNTKRKAGAINQAFPLLDGMKYVLAIDADTEISPDFIFVARNTLQKNPKLGGVCSHMGIKPYYTGNKFLYSLQKYEYALGDSIRVASGDSVQILAGMAVMYRHKILNAILQEREQVYSEDTIVEDYELSLKLREARWSTAVNLRLEAWTSVPTTFRDFYKQRRRWYGGAIRLLWGRRFRGPSKVDLSSHLFGMFMMLAQVLGISLITLALLLHLPLAITWIGIAPIAVYYIDALYRFRYVRSKRFLDYVVAFGLIPNIFYSFVNFFISIMGYLKPMERW